MPTRGSFSLSNSRVCGPGPFHILDFLQEEDAPVRTDEVFWMLLLESPFFPVTSNHRFLISISKVKDFVKPVLFGWWV